MVEQGLSFTVIEAPSPMDDPERIEAFNPRAEFYVARRVWLGATVGTDWLHEAIEADFGEDLVSYEIQSRRRAVHTGAAGEVATVALILLGAGAIDFARKFLVPSPSA